MTLGNSLGKLFPGNPYVLSTVCTTVAVLVWFPCDHVITAKANITIRLYARIYYIPLEAHPVQALLKEGKMAPGKIAKNARLQPVFWPKNPNFKLKKKFKVAHT